MSDDAASASGSMASKAEQVDIVKARLCALRDRRPTKAVRAEMALAERELDALVNAPVSGGRDPFEWLPDELVVMIIERMPFESVWRGGACERVCLRWVRLMKSAPIERRKREGRWAAYDAGVIEPRELVGHTLSVISLAVGLDGKVYSGSCDETIRVWSGADGTHLQTFDGHRVPRSLAVGLDGKIFSGSTDRTIGVWSSVDGTHLQTLVVRTDTVASLAVGLDGKIYSGSWDNSIRVWSGTDGTHLQTLVGHTDAVRALAVGMDGKVYSGSADETIRVWSGIDGSHLQTLVGHTSLVLSLAVGSDGEIYSGSNDGTIRVWSGIDGTHLHTLNQLKGSVHALAVMRDGTLVSGGGYEVECEGEGSYDDFDYSCVVHAELKVW
jgi:hypothetical protein